MTETPDADPNDGRDESPVERLDRNWNDTLQELRVTQTGTQIITGFLLTLAFQNRFTDLDREQVSIYLVLVVLATLSTILGLAPVSLHRTLFRKKAKAELVATAHRLLIATLGVLGLVVAGVVLLIFDVVISTAAGFIAGGATLLAIIAIWVLLPRAARPDRTSQHR
ncbi:DUF6328 family protein [Cryobacterium aureum]|uniref:DUF6328 family protein n=1 Tax=Cryobacterium aureum TaxID=995037 RepID=UPI000CF4E2A1|nr:DUF6328 family protein [Cryobacterium aureum]